MGKKKEETIANLEYIYYIYIDQDNMGKNQIREIILECLKCWF
jgi:hypothetical protein